MTAPKAPAKQPLETVDEWVARHIAIAPPLNTAQLDLVRRVMRGADERLTARTAGNSPDRRSA